MEKQVTTILLLALSQLPVELHIDGSAQSRRLLRAMTCEIPCHTEDLRAIAHYQEELRRITKTKQSLDCFVRIGQHNTRFEPTAYDTPIITILCLKREVDRFNRPRRQYARDIADAEEVRFAGLVDLGDSGNEQAELPQPWMESFTLSSFTPPKIEGNP
jgi:hypothetical protein